MDDYQWMWACYILRMMPKIEPETLNMIRSRYADKNMHEAITSVLAIALSKHGNPGDRKALSEDYEKLPLIGQLGVIYAARYFASGQRQSFLKSVEGHSDLHQLVVQAVKSLA